MAPFFRLGAYEVGPQKEVLKFDGACYNVMNSYSLEYKMICQTTQLRDQKRYHNRLRECRLHALVSTQVELANRSGIDRTTISALESNRLFLSIRYALRLKEVLGCSLDDLYEEVACGQVQGKGPSNQC